MSGERWKGVGSTRSMWPCCAIDEQCVPAAGTLEWLCPGGTPMEEISGHEACLLRQPVE
jgi:hypothetical protein